MAAVGSNNIYPPIVSPFSPNFVIGNEKGCRIYFSISSYNSMSEYKDIHITVTKQSDNITALNRASYPSQIKVMRASAIKEDPNRASADRYYITLENSDIEGGFKTGIVYKVQMRFSDDSSGLYSIPQKLDSYLSSHLNSFSEWSQVCLVQGINQPELQIKNGKGGILSVVDNNIFNIDTLEVVGTLVGDNADPLMKYELNLYDDRDILVETSGTLFPPYQSTIDQINYIFKTALRDGEAYTLEVKYTTYGLYEESTRYPIFTIFSTLEKMNVSIELMEDVENGRIGVHVSSDISTPFSSLATIRRTSSKSDFRLWEDVTTIELRTENLEFLWYDYTIESGVWYKYCIQKRDRNGNRGIITSSADAAMIVFDDMFLSADGQQIKIKFNPQISSYQTTVSETKVDTLGSKYPYIKRNGVTYYKQFPISGLISFMMDEEKLFMDIEKIYDEETLSLYDDYNDKNKIGDYNNIIKEKEFRDKVETFLYKHNVKLFRSATEGNVLVKLMNITFTPNQTLGRRIYSFQCTAYEVDDCTLENIDSYNIQSRIGLGDTGKIYSSEETYNGQWDTVIPAMTEFVHASPINKTYSILEKYYNKLQKRNYILSVDYLDFLSLKIYSKPYLIIDDGGSPRPYEDEPSTFSTRAAAAPTYLGYIAYINGKTIIIPEDGHYELRGKELQITSLQFARDTDVELQYHVKINQIEDESKILSITNFRNVVGQEWGGFIPGQSIYEKLWSKFYMEHPADYYQSLISIDGSRIQANPGTVVYVREEAENLADRHIIGNTESLDFFDPDSVIGDIYFTGVHFEQATDYELDRDLLPEGKCNKTEIVVDNLDKIKEPKDRYIYYLQSSNNGENEVIQAAVMSRSAPRLARLITAKGLPIFFIHLEDNKGIAIVDKGDLLELQSYLESCNYEIYTTDSLLFEEDKQIKIATSLDKTQAFEFVLDSKENQTKLKAFQVILEQYGDRQITIALKRQIWKDITYTVSDYYIYYNGYWYVYDEITNDAVCPVPASIDYTCEVMKAYYRTNEENK